MDPEDFKRLKEAATLQRDPNAQSELGVLYIEGPGFDEYFFQQDIQKGLELLRESASKGSILSKVYLFDNEDRLVRKLRRRQREEKSRRLAPIIGPIILLSFVTLVVGLGVSAAIANGWRHAFPLSVLSILSATSCFWIMLIGVFFEKWRGRRERAAAVRQKQSNQASKAPHFVFVFGCVFVVALLLLAIVFPDPTNFQYTVFRIVLSLAASGVSAFIPGLLRVRLGNWLVATGALAVFIIVYFFSPAALARGSLAVQDGQSKGSQTQQR